MNVVKRNALGIVAVLSFLAGYAVRHKRAGVVQQRIWETTWWD